MSATNCMHAACTTTSSNLSAETQVCNDTEEVNAGRGRRSESRWAHLDPLNECGCGWCKGGELGRGHREGVVRVDRAAQLGAIEVRHHQLGREGLPCSHRQATVRK